MNLTLSWDLFILVFFALVITYSFIIGKNESVKIIISSYIAIVAVQGLGNFAQRLLGFTGSTSTMDLFGFVMDGSVTSVIKLALFITIIVFLAVRAGFHVQYAHERNAVTTIALTAVCGFATAGLLLSTLLTYFSGMPLLDATAQASPALTGVMQQSTLMQLMIQNQDLWFTFPAIVLIGAGYLSNK